MDKTGHSFRKIVGRALGMIFAATTILTLLMTTSRTAEARLELAAPLASDTRWTVSPSPNSPTWHGSSLSGGLVPAGGAIDFFPSPVVAPATVSPVYAVADGTVVRICDAGTGHGFVIVDHGPGIGKVGYVHLETASMVRSGRVERGQQIAELFRAGPRFSDRCGSGSSGRGSATHLHLAFERPLNVVLGGVEFTTNRHSRDGDVVRFGTPPSSGPSCLQGSCERVCLQGSCEPICLQGSCRVATFEGSVRSWFERRGSSLNYVVCAGSAANQLVHFQLSRSGKTFDEQIQRANSRGCTTFLDVEGPGYPLRGTTYLAKAATNQSPSRALLQGGGCWASSGHVFLCDEWRW